MPRNHWLFRQHAHTRRMLTSTYPKPFPYLYNAVHVEVGWLYAMTSSLVCAEFRKEQNRLQTLMPILLSIFTADQASACLIFLPPVTAL